MNAAQGLATADQAGRTGRRAKPDGRGRVARRVVILAGRAEAARLSRSPLVLAALLVSAVLIWWNSRTAVPDWWVWDVQIDSTLLAVAGAVLVAAQLAAGRARRDNADRLYQSYPTPASARTIAHLIGLAGPLLLAAVLAGAAVLWLDLLGALGTPRPAVLAQGLLLVALGGAIGVALGSWLPNPMAGILTVIVLGTAEADLLWPFGGPVHVPGATAWLFPWTQPVVAGYLPGPTPGIPPASHLAWLAALSGLAAIAALCRAVPGRLTGVTSLTALAAAACLAAAGWSGWAQTRPVPLSVQDGILYQEAYPARVQPCISRPGVRYCAYPAFQRDVARWAAAVNGVLGRLPGRPAATLVVRQVTDSDFGPSDVGYLPATAARNSRLRGLESAFTSFLQREDTDPGLVPGSSRPPVYVDENWGRGPALGLYQLGLSLQVAWWVAGLPTTWLRSVSYTDGNTSGLTQITCLAVGQAREAIALWLAVSATPATRTAFLAGPPDYPGPAGPGYLTPVRVAGHWISGYQPAISGYFGALTYTGQGAALAEAMLRLPEQRVEAVLAARWPGWLSSRATEAQLAAALGVALPVAAAPPASMVHPGQPADPVCR